MNIPGARGAMRLETLSLFVHPGLGLGDGDGGGRSTSSSLYKKSSSGIINILY